MKLLLLAFIASVEIFLPKPGKPFHVEVLRNDYIKRVGGTLEAKEDTPTEEVWVGNWDEVLKRDTWVIPNCIGTGFILEVEISNIPANFQAVDLYVKFPPMQLPNGKVKTETRRKEELYIEGGSAYFDYSYFFDEDFERGLGFWEIELKHGERILYECKFKVVECEVEDES